MKRFWTILASVILLVAAITLAIQLRAKRHNGMPQKTFLAMGTYFTVILPADKQDYLEPAGVLTANKLYSMEAQLSYFKPSSDIGKLNNTGGKGPVELASETLSVLEAARHFSEISDGAFDVTLPPLLKAWGLRGNLKPQQPPNPSELSTALAMTGWRELIITQKTAELRRAGMEVDLGGIAKGHAVDEVTRLVYRHGLTNILLNLGGNIRVLGSVAADKPWRIAVRNPFDQRRVLGTIDLRNGEALSTSGNYERFVTIDGKQYSHIMDPRTGQPVMDMAGVTVLCGGADAARTADALSTTLFVLGIDAGVRFLNKHFQTCSAMFVTDIQPPEIHMTKEFADRFQPADDCKGKLLIIPP